MLPRADVVALLTAATVFACPSVYEPLGIVNLEAMACETAVVATATGGIPEVVVDGETGLLVPIEQASDGTGSPLDRERFEADLAAALDRRSPPTPTGRPRWAAPGRARAVARVQLGHRRRAHPRRLPGGHRDVTSRPRGGGQAAVPVPHALLRAPGETTDALSYHCYAVRRSCDGSGRRPGPGDPGERGAVTGRAHADEVHAPVPAVDWSADNCPGGEAPPRVDCARVAGAARLRRPDGRDDLAVDESAPGQALRGQDRHAVRQPGRSRWVRFRVRRLRRHAVPAGVVDRFDIVGIDPRGIAYSTPVRCRSDRSFPAFPRVPFPIGKPQVHRQIAFDEGIRDMCRNDHNAVLDHMSTADVARDMDLVRQALGEDEINYYGISYGSYLGTTYAAMFPDNIRALAVDGVLDPVAWATGRKPGQWHRDPFSARLRSQTGAFESMRDALAQCDVAGKQRCALAGDAAGTWRAVLRKLSHGPVRIKNFGKVYYQDVVGLALGVLYDRQSIPFLMEYVDALAERLLDRQHESRGYGAALAALQRSIRGQLLPGPYGADSGAPGDPWGGPVNGSAPPTGGRSSYWPGFEGVACSDSLNPGRSCAGRRPPAGRRTPGAGSAGSGRGRPVRARAGRVTTPTPSGVPSRPTRQPRCWRSATPTIRPPPTPAPSR